MRGKAVVKVVASVPDISVDQFIAAAAAARYIGLQNEEALVSPSFDDMAAFESYQPRIDLSLVAPPDMTAEEIAAYFKFSLFPERFLNRFCTDLLLGSEHPTRRVVEDHFESLQQLALPAREEFEALREFTPLGPQQFQFYQDADDLIDFITTQIERRLDDPRYKDALRELLIDLR